MSFLICLWKFYTFSKILHLETKFLFCGWNDSLLLSSAVKVPGIYLLWVHLFYSNIVFKTLGKNILKGHIFLIDPFIIYLIKASGLKSFVSISCISKVGIFLFFESFKIDFKLWPLKIEFPRSLSLWLQRLQQQFDISICFFLSDILKFSHQFGSGFIICRYNVIENRYEVRMNKLFFLLTRFQKLLSSTE